MGLYSVQVFISVVSLIIVTVFITVIYKNKEKELIKVIIEIIGFSISILNL